MGMGKKKVSWEKVFQIVLQVTIEDQLRILLHPILARTIKLFMATSSLVISAISFLISSFLVSKGADKESAWRAERASNLVSIFAKWSSSIFAILGYQRKVPKVWHKWIYGWLHFPFGVTEVWSRVIFFKGIVADFFLRIKTIKCILRVSTAFWNFFLSNFSCSHEGFKWPVCDM